MDALAHTNAVVDQLAEIVEDNGCSSDVYSYMIDLLGNGLPIWKWDAENDEAQRLRNLLLAMLEAVPYWEFDAAVALNVARRLQAAL